MKSFYCRPQSRKISQKSLITPINSNKSEDKDAIETNKSILWHKYLTIEYTFTENPKKNYSIHSKIAATKERHFSKANKAYVSIKMKINFNKLLEHS